MGCVGRGWGAGGGEGGAGLGRTIFWLMTSLFITLEPLNICPSVQKIISDFLFCLRSFDKICFIFYKSLDCLREVKK